MSYNDELEIKTAEDAAKELEGAEPKDPEEVIEAAEKAEEISEEQLQDVLKAEEEEEIKEIAEALEEASETEAPKKKKSFVQIPVIIAACVFLAALLGYFVYTAFFLHEPEGVWEYVADDGTSYFYTFDKDGNSIMTVGTISYMGSFSKTKDEEGGKLSINQYYGMLAGEYSYEVTGSKLLKNQEMILTTGDYSYTLTQSKIKDDYITPDENFTEDKDLTGEWEFVFEDYGVSYKFKFNADGTMQINQYDTYIYDCVYTAENGMISCTFYTYEPTTEEFEYTVNGNTLTMLGMDFTRVGSATADEA